MWKRRQLKRNAKSALRATYWRCVLVALILAGITGGGVSGLVGGGLGAATGGAAGLVGQNYVPASLTEQADLTETRDPVTDQAAAVISGKTPDTQEATWENILDLMAQTPEVQALSEQLSRLDRSDFLVILAVLGGIVGVILLCAFLVQLLLINPLLAGCKYFFARNSEERAMAGTMAGGFDRGFGRVVKGMFLKDLFLFFWTLLFIIPGIIKSFSYRMVPYILVDQPELTATQAIRRSKQMMKGNKWRAFVLDLSFILWYILSALTLGLVGLFFVNPYYEATNAELYQVLKAGEPPLDDDDYDDYDDEYDDDGYDQLPPEQPQDPPVNDLPQDAPVSEPPQNAADSDAPQELPEP